jgi:hypothetical protein
MSPLLAGNWSVLSFMIYVSVCNENVALLFQNAVLSTDFGLNSIDFGIFFDMALINRRKTKLLGT